MKTSRILGLFMSSLVAALIGCSGSDGAQGPAGAPGQQGQPGPAGSATTGDPSVNAVTPSHVFLARKAEITISGYGTAWTNSTKVDFGADVTVDKLSLASPTALIASVTIARSAALGARDVTVKDGDKTEVYKAAFHVDAPLALTLTGTIAQGSVFAAHGVGKDLATPFDTTSSGDGVFTPITYPNLVVGGTNGINAQISAASLYSVDFLVLADVNAPAAAQDIELQSGPSGSAEEFPAPKAFTLAARQPKALVSGTPATGTMAKPLDSELYSLTPAAGVSLVDFVVTSTTAGASPTVVLLPKSGKFADLIGAKATQTVVANGADPFYAVVVDLARTPSYPFSLAARSTPATAIAASATATTAANAQAAATLPAVLQSGVLTGAADQHWIKYTATAGDVGKVFHVVTYDADKKTDTLVDVRASDGTTSLGGPSNDNGYHEDFTSSAITTAGTYYVVVKASTMFDSAHKTFGAWVRLE